MRKRRKSRMVMTGKLNNKKKERERREKKGEKRERSGKEKLTLEQGKG